MNALQQKNVIQHINVHATATTLTKLTDHFSYCKPKADIKISMAKAVVNEFPFLKDEEGQGIVSYNTFIINSHACTENASKFIVNK